MRALAIFLVVTWHFTHGESSQGFPVPIDYAPGLFPFALLDEGHTGVSLFMVLSGYLFAKLLQDKSIHYPAFLWNRALRLLPLLALVLAAAVLKEYLTGGDLDFILRRIAWGWLYPSLPNGGWSVTAEFHYYAILPLFLWMLRKSPWLPLVILAAAMALRAALNPDDSVRMWFAYFTIVGRVDQFVLGMMAQRFSDRLEGRHGLAFGVIAAFAFLYWQFDLRGGYHGLQESSIWIYLPTLEGLAYAVAIAWYDSSFEHATRGASAFAGRIGEYSYSIYLLHFFFVFDAAAFVHRHVMDISNFYLACLWSIVFFLLMMLPGYVSYRWIETPFLRRRRPYILQGDKP